jgi:hypothetical protein
VQLILHSANDFHPSYQQKQNAEKEFRSDHHIINAIPEGNKGSSVCIAAQSGAKKKTGRGYCACNSDEGSSE